MWTVVVEVHLGKKEAVFQVGAFLNPEDAAAFADELEWEIGENKITASIIQHEHLFEWLVNMVVAKKKKDRQNPKLVGYPPCTFDEFDIGKNLEEA